MPKPQDTKDVYQYTALGRREIRVVLLHPWDSIDGIRCEMTHVSLGDNPKYEALSYTWGSATNKAFIKVGSTWLSVTQNLFNALHALSPPSSHRIIWIDAMCINQNDPTERDHQVAFMKDIYTRASRVIVWLGSAADNSDAVMDYIGTIIPEPNLTEHKSWVYSETWNWDECRPWQQLPVPQESVSALLSRPWFSRVWIQQEAAVNRETRILCGDKDVNWSQLFSLVWSYQKPDEQGFARDKLSNKAQASAMLVLNIQSYTYEDVPPLLVDILRDCTYCGATDPRDRIYAVQSLAGDTDIEKLVLEPNYACTVSDVYTELAERFLQLQGPFILCWAGRNHQELLELPSWVPDWTAKNIEIPSIIFNAAGNMQFRCNFHNSDGLLTLCTNGISVSNVSALTELAAMPVYQGRLGELEIFELFRNHIESCIKLCEVQKDGFSENANKQDIWRVLVTDSTREWTRVPKEYGNGFALFHRWLLTYQQKAPSDIPPTYREHVETMNLRGVFIHRRFAIDSKGNMCIVPYATRQGDSIVLVAGLAMPLVARLCENGRLEIIGECYVHGYMDGEAVVELRQAEEELCFC